MKKIDITVDSRISGTVKKEKQVRKGSRWYTIDTDYETFNGRFYQNCIDSVHIFGDRVQYTYTKYGYIPVKFTSVAPGGMERSVRTFCID